MWGLGGSPRSEGGGAGGSDRCVELRERTGGRATPQEAQPSQISHLGTHTPSSTTEYSLRLAPPAGGHSLPLKGSTWLTELFWKLDALWHVPYMALPGDLFLLALRNQLPCFQRNLQKMEKQPVGRDIRNGVYSVSGFGAPFKIGN